MKILVFRLQMADYIFNPVMRGIFAGDVSKLSVKSCLPDLYEMEQTYGSLVRAILVKAVGPDITSKYPSHNWIENIICHLQVKNQNLHKY
jgi:hypothetical protein